MAQRAPHSRTPHSAYPTPRPRTHRTPQAIVKLTASRPLFLAHTAMPIALAGQFTQLCSSQAVVSDGGRTVTIMLTMRHVHAGDASIPSVVCLPADGHAAISVSGALMQNGLWLLWESHTFLFRGATLF